MLQKFVFFFSLLLLSSCTKSIQGYRFSDKKTSRIHIKESKLDDVIHILGKPTTMDEIDGKHVLIYAQSQYYSFLFVRKKMIHRRIDVYYFDTENVLLHIKNLSLDHENDFRSTGINIRLENPNKKWALPFYLIV